jgi:hypothetical protein
MRTFEEIPRERYWQGPVRNIDDFDQAITDTFIDGATIYGPWAMMTPASHRLYGQGLGTGRGQKYEKQSDGQWLKVEG